MFFTAFFINFQICSIVFINIGFVCNLKFPDYFYILELLKVDREKLGAEKMFYVFILFIILINFFNYYI